MLIEQTTTYAYKLKYLENPSFDKVKTMAKKFIDELPKKLVDDLFNAINRGVDILKTEPEMLVYLYSFGNMHKAKLDFAFEKFPEEFFSQPEINIIDYGCGQAIGTMCYTDFLKSKNYNQRIKSVTLIEPSEICIKRAALHTSVFLPDAMIITVNKTFDELVEEDIYCEDNVPTLHILSNVLDLEFDLERFSELIKGRLLGYNQFICVGPLFYSDNLDHRMRYFSEFIGGDVLFSESFGKGDFIEGKNWTCQTIVFSKDELNYDLSTKVLDDDYQNSIKDEFGFEYSCNGEKLLCCNTYDLKCYEIKNGTRFICDWAFWDAGLNYEDRINQIRTVVIPNSIVAIGRYAFKSCEFVQKIIIPNSVTYIGDYAFEFCNSLQEIIIPNSVIHIGDGAFYGCKSLQQIVISDYVKYIGAKAFAGCKSLREIILPYSVTYLKNSAFGGCESLQSITIQNPQIYIDKQLFGNFKKQSSMIVPPERLTCESLQRIYVPKESIDTFKQMLPKEYWDKLYYLKKEEDDVGYIYDDLPF